VACPRKQADSQSAAIQECGRLDKHSSTNIYTGSCCPSDHAALHFKVIARQAAQANYHMSTCSYSQMEFTRIGSLVIELQSQKRYSILGISMFLSIILSHFPSSPKQNAYNDMFLVVNTPYNQYHCSNANSGRNDDNFKISPLLQ